MPSTSSKSKSKSKTVAKETSVSGDVSQQLTDIASKLTKLMNSVGKIATTTKAIEKQVKAKKVPKHQRVDSDSSSSSDDEAPIPFTRPPGMRC